MTSRVGVPAGGRRGQPSTEGWDFPSSSRCHDERVCFSSGGRKHCFGLILVPPLWASAERACPVQPF